MKLTDTLTLKERDKAAASILAGKLQGDVRFKGRRWYLWNDAENRWERATDCARCHPSHPQRDSRPDCLCRDREELRGGLRLDSVPRPERRRDTA